MKSQKNNAFDKVIYCYFWNLSILWHMKKWHFRLVRQKKSHNTLLLQGEKQIIYVFKSLIKIYI